MFQRRIKNQQRGPRNIERVPMSGFDETFDFVLVGNGGDSIAAKHAVGASCGAA
jgi:hypothetical protein